MLWKKWLPFLKILFHLNVPSNSPGEKKKGVELTESLFIDVTIPKPAPTLKVSQIFVLPIPRLGSCEEVQGWIRKTAQYQYDKVKSNMLHLGQPTVWMLPVRSSTTYTKGQQNHLTLKMGTSHIHLVIPGQAKSSHEACDTPWPWGFLYLVLRDHRRCLVTFAQFGSRMHHQTGSHQVISCRFLSL